MNAKLKEDREDLINQVPTKNKILNIKERELMVSNFQGILLTGREDR
ncbi:MAG: hypothetical protein PHX21_08605 [bacterium]|nr:hypothetical protein [bacterium]